MRGEVQQGLADTVMTIADNSGGHCCVLVCGEAGQGVSDTMVTIDDNGGGHVVFQCVEKLGMGCLIRW